MGIALVKPGCLLVADWCSFFHKLCVFGRNDGTGTYQLLTIRFPLLACPQPQPERNPGELSSPSTPSKKHMTNILSLHVITSLGVWVRNQVSYVRGFCHLPSLKLTAFVENQRLEDEFPFWDGLFSGLCGFQGMQIDLKSYKAKPVRNNEIWYLFGTPTLEKPWQF